MCGGRVQAAHSKLGAYYRSVSSRRLLAPPAFSSVIYSATVTIIKSDILLSCTPLNGSSASHTTALYGPRMRSYLFNAIAADLSVTDLYT